MSTPLIITSTIADGNMSFRFGEPDVVLKNRIAFFEKHNLAYENCVSMQSNHNDIVALVAGETPGKLVKDEHESIEADALVTQQTGLVLALLTADCLPVTLFDATTDTIALVHISRHTLAKNLLKETLVVLNEQCNVQPGNIAVTIGPHIKPESYCFPAPLPTLEDALKPYVTEQADTVCIDLVACTLDQLEAGGVKKENVSISEADTFTDPNYFSHRRSSEQNEPEGRLLTIASLS